MDAATRNPRGQVERRLPRWPAMLAPVVAVLLATGLPTVTTSSPAGPAARDLPATNSAPQVAAGRALWTAERMAAAVPDPPLPVTATPAGVRLAAAPAGASPRTVTQQVVSQAQPWPGSSTSPPRTHTGELFFRRAGFDYRCSAVTVNSVNKSLVMTAGHCLFRDGVWASDIVYAPNYDGVRNPRYEWQAIRWNVPFEWQREDAARRWSSQWDVGFVVVRPDAQGFRLAQRTGAVEIDWTALPGNTELWAFGYPANPPFTGTKLTYCTGTWIRLSPFGPMLRCNMGPTAAGGPWFRSFTTHSDPPGTPPDSGNGRLATVTSHFDVARSIMLGPYLNVTVNDPQPRQPIREEYTRMGNVNPTLP
jgi:hypothetical protein